MEQHGRADEKLDEAVEEMQSDAEEMQEGLEKLGDDQTEDPPNDEPADGGNGDSGQQLDHTSGDEQSEAKPEEQDE